MDSVALQLAALTDAGLGSEGDSVQVARGGDRARGSGWEPTHLSAPQLSGVTDGGRLRPLGVT